MISINEACEIYLKEFDEKPYIISINDFGYGFAFTSSWTPEEVTTDDGVGIVNKTTGEIKYYAYPQVIEQILEAKEIEVPEKYAYKKS